MPTDEIYHQRYERVKEFTREWVKGTGLDQGMDVDPRVRTDPMGVRWGYCYDCSKLGVVLDAKINDAYRKRCHECHGVHYDAARLRVGDEEELVFAHLPERVPHDEPECTIYGEDWWF